MSALAALAVVGQAAAATECGKKVLSDWYDNGRIDRLYPLHCYEEAIDAIPSEIRDYSDAEEVISRALQAAVGGKLASGGRDPSPSNGNAPNRNGKKENGGPGGKGPGDEPGESEAGGAVDTSGPSAVPIPLLVLGGLSLALLAAGGLGYVSRRRQATDGPDGPDDPTLG